LVVNTCTGYICPGISTYLIEKLGLSRRVRAYDLVGSGCGGAIPNLEIAQSLLARNGDGVVVSVSVEICTATFQMENDLSLLLSNTLFGDGAAAAVLWTRPVGYELVASASRYVPEQRDTIRYVHKHGQLYNQLSLKLPDLVRKAAAQVVADVLEPQSLKPRISSTGRSTAAEKRSSTRFRTRSGCRKSRCCYAHSIGRTWQYVFAHGLVRAA
jgi:predicted naringenin-chalcone synthase